MTQEELKYLNFTMETHFRVLRLVRKQYHNNEWTDEYNKLVIETKDKMIWDLENFFLLPDYTFDPITRNFKDEDNEMRQAIAKEVNNNFKHFRQEQND
jgi:hypothetical protein